MKNPLSFFNSSNLTTEFQAIGYMIAGVFWFACMAALVRHLSAEMHPFQIVFFRNAASLICILPWLHKIGIKSLNASKLTLYSLRGVNGFFSMLLWFMALAAIPLPVAVSLSFTTPLFTVIAAMLLLHEKVGYYRICALIMGFIGTVIILRPGTVFEYSYLLVLASSVMWAFSNIIIKRLTVTESPESIVFFMVLIMTPLSIPFAIPYWQPVKLDQWGWVLLLGIVSNLAQVSISYAYGKADMGVLQPFDFLRLIFSSFIAYFAFNEIIDSWTLSGAVVIMASCIYISHREARVKRRKRAEEMLEEIENI